MTVAIIGLLMLAAISLGLRTTSVLLNAGIHPATRFVIALAAGGLLTLVVLQVCDSYHVFEFGLGLLLSLSPVGVFDVAKWWFKWRNQPQRG